MINTKLILKPQQACHLLRVFGDQYIIALTHKLVKYYEYMNRLYICININKNNGCSLILNYISNTFTGAFCLLASDNNIVYLKWILKKNSLPSFFLFRDMNYELQSHCYNFVPEKRRN